MSYTTKGYKTGEMSIKGEVKEVDLEKEIKRFTMSKELYEADSVIKAVAEHFFELGLKARKGE